MIEHAATLVEARGCRRKRKLVEGSKLHRVVHDHPVYRRRSPEQIAQRLRRK